MGYKFNHTEVTCPLFERVINTKKFIGIECEPFDVNLGFNVAPAVRVETQQDLEDYTDIFCKDLYETCPYYKAYEKYGGT